MYVERKYTASSQVGSDRTFWCLQCDFKCPALILGVGDASTTSFGLAHNEGAALAARTNAEAAAQDDARETFGLIPCPRCGARDPTAMRRFRILGILFASFAGLSGAVVGVVVAKESAGYMNPNVMAMCTVGAVVGFAVGGALAVGERVLELRSRCGRANLFPDHAPSTDLTRL